MRGARQREFLTETLIRAAGRSAIPVPYNHLTLPTISPV